MLPFRCLQEPVGLEIVHVEANFSGETGLVWHREFHVEVFSSEVGELLVSHGVWLVPHFLNLNLNPRD